ncbi:MAG: leucine-rich repeat domain-containing protein [Akkermansiaceae bacterium]
MRSLQALLALFACAFLPLHAADLSDLAWTEDGDQVTITDCDEAATGLLVIPSIIEGKSVVSIAPNAFRSCTSLTNITIPDGVPSIDCNTFSDCNSLTSITIPTSVTDIGQWAFSGCSTLARITITGSAKVVGRDCWRI